MPHDQIETDGSPRAEGDGFASLRMQLTGMSCASCAGRAERALSAVPGVTSARVILAQEAAEVTLQPPADAAVLARAAQAAGYPARQQETALSLDGMSCASCVGRVRAAMLAVPGVLEADVNLALGEVRVTRLVGSAPDAALAAAARAAGYPARVQAADRTLDSAEDARATEISSMGRRAAIAGVLTLPVFVLEMGGHLFPPFHHWLMGFASHSTLWGLQFLLTLAVLAGPGRVFFARGLPLLLKGAPDMNALVALGTGAAFAFSTVALFAPGLLPEGTAAVYFEAAAVIATLVLAGRWMEARARGRAGAAIAALMRLAPADARVERDGEVVELPVAEIVPGDRLHLRPGERMAVDGVVVSGESHADESMITGEPMPVAKGPGDPVTAGTVNAAGALVVEARKVGADTALAQIVRMVERAQATRLPIQSLLDRVVAVFVPAVMGVAVLTVVVWLLLGPSPALGMALVAGVSVLIIACPCAMGLATPVSIMVGTGRAAGMGVLFRRGEALQRLEDVRLVAFDKTG
ncbi:MAG: heavy metal translocating P-type ATPase, partial [Rhodobacteraceae bacterium]|nr:heavy metal translocating P-type ATPase [Paracoccaceae bacterium]